MNNYSDNRSDRLDWWFIVSGLCYTGSDPDLEEQEMWVRLGHPQYLAHRGNIDDDLCHTPAGLSLYSQPYYEHIINIDNDEG